jgi:hypothetical protein
MIFPFQIGNIFFCIVCQCSRAWAKLFITLSLYVNVACAVARDLKHHITSNLYHTLMPALV